MDRRVWVHLARLVDTFCLSICNRAGAVSIRTTDIVTSVRTLLDEKFVFAHRFLHVSQLRTNLI